MTDVTHVCPTCGERDNASGDCWSCRTPLVSPEPGFEYKFEGEVVKIVEKDGVILTDGDGVRYTIESLGVAIENGDAVVSEGNQ